MGFFYLLLPVFALVSISSRYPELSSSSISGQLAWVMVMGIVLVVIAQFQVRYAVGDIRRLAINLLFLICAVGWIFGLLGGKMEITQTWNEFTFHLDVSNLLYLVFGISTLNGIFYFLEYLAFKPTNEVTITPETQDADDNPMVVEVYPLPVSVN